MTHNKKKYNKAKFYIYFAAIIALMAVISHIWGLSPLNDRKQAETAQNNISENNSDVYHEAPVTEADSDATTYNTDSDKVVEDEYVDMTEGEGTQSTYPDFVSAKVWNYPLCFPDSNATQLVVAKKNGVEPMRTHEAVIKKVKEKELTNIAGSPYYYLEELTHSMPYLVPKAQMLLNTIGINFVDSLHSKGYDLFLPIVTSVLRTSEDIRGLQQGNGNSVTNSCHCYGTTIDITYNRFMPLSGSAPANYDPALKKVLAEVLFDLREEGRCYVKYEKRQACFHLTVI